MHRFRVPPGDLSAGKVRLRGAELRHLRDVLRIGSGEEVELFDGAGQGAVAVVDAVDRTTAELTIVGPNERHAESPLAITLAVGLAKGSKLDWIVEKTTELGVARVVPFTSERTIPEQGSAAKVDRWRRIAAAAAAQSGRTVCPVIDEVTSFSEILASAAAHDRAILFWEEGREALPTTPDATMARVVVMTGPEGGFTVAEADAARRAGFAIARLGPRVLRAETAAVTAVALVQLAWGDLLMAPGAC